MSNLLANIKICKATRSFTAQAMSKILQMDKLSEIEFCQQTAEQLYKSPNWARGWYDPPPKGIAALFGPEDNISRVAYDSLRKEEFWPKNNIFTNNSLGYIYASPVNKLSGIIGDFGMTIYKGNNQKIINHLKTCLEITEKTAEYAEVGMEFKDVYNYCQNLMSKKGLNNNRMLAINDKTKTNIGHSIPFSHELPTEQELNIINGEDFDKLKNLISSKRITLNAAEQFKIPETIAFTVEPRIENNDTPLVSFHLVVAFKEGKKEIFANFNPVFEAVNMHNFIVSKY